MISKSLRGNFSEDKTKEIGEQDLQLLTPFFFLFFFFFGHTMSMWDLSSPTRDQTHAPCIGSAES